MDTKATEINNRHFILKKMDARTGSFLIFKLTKLLPPILEHLNLDALDENDFEIKDLQKLNLTEALEPIFNLPENEFKYIQDNCLKCVSELLPAGDQPVLQKNGEWGINNIEFDTGLVMNLTVQELIFNLKGFFLESPLSSMMKSLNLSQQNTQI